ncbi:MAG: tyrosine-type recombinase/integrase [Flavihumibacter sp.]|nr:tyrosine-type recombinase/integrase [Flavihumibacter sp.]
MFNAARKRKIISCYPFDTFSLPEEYSKPKEYLSLAEEKKIESNLKKLKGTQYAASLYFLLGCYTGLRVSEWRVFSASERIRDGWVRVVPLKNKGWVSMPMPPGLARIVPALMETKCLNSEQQINDLLRDLLPEIGITRHITTHCARHTFAVTMCAERGISCEVCSELMGITVQTCAETYYKVTNVKIEKEVVKAWKGL